MQTKEGHPQSRVGGPGPTGLEASSDNNPLDADKESEWFCSSCGSRITITDMVGEAGHAPDCPRRETHYTGLSGQTGFRNGRLNTEGSA